MNLHLDWATIEASRYACRKWHYSKCLPAGKLVKIGVWENEKFIGVVIYGYGANNNAAKYYSLQQTEVCELVRVALTTHETPVSKILSISLKMLRKANPGLKVVFSYSDVTNQNHHGGIYQANAWLYIGTRTTSDKGAYYQINGKKMHGRSARAKYGSESKFPRGWKHWPSQTKHLYVKILDKNHNFTLKTFSYPKRVEHESNAVTNHVAERGAIPTDTLQTSTGLICE